MDDVFFGVKRAYWATFRFSARRLVRFGITPARINLLRVIFTSPGETTTQAELRHRLGVARSVVSRMLRALELLELVVRPRFDDDRRTRKCELTPRGRALLVRVWRELVHSGVVAHAINASLRTPLFMRRVAGAIFHRLTFSFGRWGPLHAP